MILILSTNQDVTTDSVMDWLSYYKTSFRRINDHDLFESNILDISFDKKSKKVFTIKDKESNKNITRSINAVWFRKFGFFDELKINTKKEYISFTHLLKDEYYTVIRIFSNLLDSLSVKWLCDYKNIFFTKINMLLAAKEVGLTIPYTVVSSSKTEIAKFKKNKNDVITKSVKDGAVVYNENGMFSMHTKTISDEDIKKLPTNFFPSLIQECLDKEYELRIFYLMGKCYSMAIFSQLDEQTKTDFRNYNWQKPNRNVPYQLPKNIERKIKRLMTTVGLNTGSIDMVKTKKGEYVFLEVNPVGQFGMVSKPCNYFLEEKVAESLIKLADEKTKIRRSSKRR